MLHEQLRPLQALMSCVRMQWLCILTGESGCGKTSLVRLLARLSARRLSEAVLSTATDTTELLGCFEQNEPSRLQEPTLTLTLTLTLSLTLTMTLTLTLALTLTLSRPTRCRRLCAARSTARGGGCARGVSRARCVSCGRSGCCRRRRWLALALG